MQVQPVWWLGNQFPEYISRNCVVTWYLGGRTCPAKRSLFLCASQRAISGWFLSGTKCKGHAVSSIRCYPMVTVLKHRRQLHVNPEFLSYIFADDERVYHLTSKNWRPRRWRGNNHIRQEIGDIYIKRLALLWATDVLSEWRTCVIWCLNLHKAFKNIAFRQYYNGR